MGVSNNVYDKSYASTIAIGLSNSSIDIDQELLDNIIKVAQNTDNHNTFLVTSCILSIFSSLGVFFESGKEVDTSTGSEFIVNLAEAVTFIYFAMQVCKLTYDWVKNREVSQNSSAIDDVNELFSLSEGDSRRIVEESVVRLCQKLSICSR
ncbi:MAG: hypothetical protein ACI9IL_001180 [Rickettsiales bacterium]|jgi:hypothetical protein